MTADPNDPETHDPLEGLNRTIFEVNDAIYDATSPIVEATPDPVKGMFKALGTAVNAPIHIVTSIATDDPKRPRPSLLPLMICWLPHVSPLRV